MDRRAVAKCHALEIQTDRRAVPVRRIRAAVDAGAVELDRVVVLCFLAVVVLGAMRQAVGVQSRAQIVATAALRMRSHAVRVSSACRRLQRVEDAGARVAPAKLEVAAVPDRIPLADLLGAGESSVQSKFRLRPVGVIAEALGR